MAQTIIGLFDLVEQAQAGVQALLNNGVPHDGISLVANGRPIARAVGQDLLPGDPVSAGAATGGTLGMLPGLGMLTLPGLGPVLVAGPLTAAIGMALASAGEGAPAGGLIGALTSAGIPDDDAHVYAQSILRGGAIVAVTTGALLGAAVSDLLSRAGAVDAAARRTELRGSGWEGFDPAASRTSMAGEPDSTLF
ncbi:MAG: hypothetical protein OHK0022_39720 [Roseiflexaceae bacterium]